MTHRKIKILIAEDEYIIAMDIKKVLEKLGYEVTSFVGKGIDAIKRTETEKPDIILMDIMLSDQLSGIDTAQIIKSKYDVPIVYLTALTDEETLQKAKLTEPGGYLLKPFDERGLHSAIEIALYKFRMESQLKQKTKELEEEKNRNDELLHHILPDEIIKELKLNGVVVPRHFESVSILFTDFLGFRQIINSLQPAELISDLNEIFSNFDLIVEKYGLEKLKTIGDTYMACVGLSEKSKDHAAKVIYATKEMLDYLSKKNQNSKVEWILKAGINTGPIVAGIVGTNKFTYDVWGDTVNIASRMESSSGAGKINISGGTYELVKEYFNCEYRGKLAVKGKGEVDMYFVNVPGENGNGLQ
ncbi:MAG: adenylate/guanylate cyclase domain-containing protein [Ignavibacteriaceae bacterium]|nr:adenylate/guanylate cyclase domain-containing protein [Ignavibacteriaceae bacterium]